MARSLDRSVRFIGAGGAVFNMVLVLALVLGIVWYLSPLSPQPNPLLSQAFMANPYLNGLILFVLLIGIMYNLRQAMLVGPAVRWIMAFRNSVDPSRTRLPRAPMLISAVSRILLDADERGGRLSQASTRAILDSVGLRIDEGREIGRYATNLLVFLGLLGTFWGLLQTVNGVADVIGSLAGTTSDQSGSDAVGSLIANLNAPLSGMGTAFSSSLFGLGGSLVLGLLDIQAGQAQNRFYSDLEDWLSGITDNTTGRAAENSAAFAGDLEGVLGRLDQTLTQLARGNEEGNEALQQEVRQLTRAVLDSRKTGGR
jgi:hypothetical protein